MRALTIFPVLVVATLSAAAALSERPDPRFDLVALGSAGGLDEGDLTAFLLSRHGEPRHVLLDAGTVRAGLERAVQSGALAPPTGEPARPDRPPTAAQRILTEQVKAVLITHPHLDHVAGLAINATDDAKKPLLALPSTVDGLRTSLFNWTLWPNFGSEGDKPLGQYRYQRLEPGVATSLVEPGLQVTAFPLSHGGVVSTMFLLEDGEAAVAFFGDTGPDEVEKSERLDRAWAALAPLVRAGRLRGIVIEVSYGDARADGLLFGHLTPRWLVKELSRLARKVRPDEPARALAGLPVVVSHVKPSTEEGVDMRARIAEQLERRNTLGVRFVHLRQGEKLEL